MPIFGYSRLIGYDRNLDFVADILESYEISEDRVFTFRLREGHRWSDGSPLTAEDFRYAWEDVMMDPDLPGVPIELIPDGVPPDFSVIDARTVRYEWPVPNPGFLPALAAPSPPQLVAPSAYLKQFHAKYQTVAALETAVEANRVDDWRALHTKMCRTNRPENPDLPTLEPWRPRTAPPAQRFVFERNPYFHRTDETGVQLPYVDRVLLDVSSYEIIPAKVAAGDSDLQATAISFNHYTVLKEAEKRVPVNVLLWKGTQGSRLALYPNMTCQDPVWSVLFRDVRVRRALSLAIDRTEINKALFFGLCTESANTVLPASALHRPEYSAAWAYHDPDQANALLDAAGLSRPALDGRRRLPDGRVAGIIVETAGESSVETDVLELITEHFRRIGLALWTRSSQRDIFRSRILAGQVLMSVWVGIDNGIPTSEMPPSELAPTSEDQLQWPAWGLHYMSGSRQGTAPELPEVQRLVDLMKAWKRTRSAAERRAVWGEMLAIHADQVFSIGTVCNAPQPVLRARDLRNVPEEAYFGYSPTSMLGIYNPDTFWRDTDGS
ncbi:ABC transporter substrate-binding protein [Mangrovicoccus ximenensis]|uniref:ABC transporter substrate-binding protein n=1 Tax=Mangrovicoccus ximenensis TaxID=1911570 RepID=UPI001F42AEB4|nr:ABC transporter substrate-binding protein [Mangrovicoccus ximenensis]